MPNYIIIIYCVRIFNHLQILGFAMRSFFCYFGGETARKAEWGRRLRNRRGSSTKGRRGDSTRGVFGGARDAQSSRELPFRVTGTRLGTVARYTWGPRTP